MCYIDHVNCQLVKKKYLASLSLPPSSSSSPWRSSGSSGFSRNFSTSFSNSFRTYFLNFCLQVKAFLNEILTFWYVDYRWAFKSVVSRVHFSIQRRIRNCRTLIFIIENLVFRGLHMENRAKITWVNPKTFHWSLTLISCKVHQPKLCWQDPPSRPKRGWKTCKTTQISN